MSTYLLLASVVHIDVNDNVLCNQSPVGEGVNRVVRKDKAAKEVPSSRDNHWRGGSLGCKQEEEEHALQEHFFVSSEWTVGQSTGRDKPRTGRERREGEITTK